MAATLDVWDIAPESAKRVQHPAPFPVELPERLIRLYTYEKDLVLDPFMGSGSTLVAAAKVGRRFVGYDLDSDYVELARCRLETVTARPGGSRASPTASKGKVSPPPAAPPEEDFQARASREGKAAQAIAEQVLRHANFSIVRRNYRLRRLGLTVNIVAADAEGQNWYFDVTGAFTTTRGGLLRTDTVWKCLGRAHVLGQRPGGWSHAEDLPHLTSTEAGERGRHRPAGRREGCVLRCDRDALRRGAVSGWSTTRKGAITDDPLPGFWTKEDLASSVDEPNRSPARSSGASLRRSSPLRISKR